MASPVVILAGGAWMGGVASWVDFPIPVRPRHGEVLHARLPGDPIRLFILTARHGPIAPRRDGDAAELVADATKLQRTLQWKPERSELRDILRDAWEFFQRS